MFYKFIQAMLLICLVIPIYDTKAQESDGEEYVVQSDDWLSKIADKFYGDMQAYAQIVEATNLKAATDERFTLIENPDLIEVGQILWIPQAVDSITINNISFEPITVEGLGIETVIPSNWPRIGGDDPLLAHAWRAGPFSFLNLMSTPGNDAQAGVARLLGVSSENLDSDIIGGSLIEEQFNGRDWTIYIQDDGRISTVAGATVHEKVIYQFILTVQSAQRETVLSTILGNFTISDTSSRQQVITIEVPAPKTALTDPFELRGTTDQYPFKGTLIYRVLDEEGNQVGRGPLEVTGKLGTPTTFAVAGTYNVETGGPGTVEVSEMSAADGAIIAIDSVGVTLIADPPGYTITIDDPLPYASVTSPVQVRGKTSDKPFEGTLDYRIVDAFGEEISRGFLESRGQIGEVNLFDDFVEFTISEDGPGRIEIFDVNEADGSILTISTVNVWLTTAR